MVPGIFLALYNIVLVKKYMDIFLETRKGRVGWAGWLPFAFWEVLKITHAMGLKDMELLTGQNPGVNLGLNIAVMGIVGLVSYVGEIWKRLLFPVAYVALLTAVEALVVFGFGYLTGGGISTGAYFFASNVIVSLVIIGIWFYAARQEIQQGTVRKGNFLLIIPFISIGIYYILFEAAISAGIHDRKMLAGLIIAAVMVLAALLTVYLLYARLAKEYQILKNNQTYLNQMEAYELYFSAKENDDQELVRMRHDLKQMLLLMRSQIMNKEYGEMEKLVNGLIGSTFSLARIKYNTGNPALDAHLNELETVASEKGIAAYIGTDVPGKMNFAVEDLSVLLGNAIDNAVEALEKIQEGSRRIWVDIQYNKGMLLIRIKNDCIPEAGRKNMGSSKKEKYHGIGLQSITRVARKYKGSMRTGVKEGLFCLEVTLYENT